MSDERASRPELGRDHPIRSFANLWTEAASRSPTSSADDDADPPDTSRFIENGVRNAYTVVDRYISEGQRIASQIGQSYAELGLGEGGREFQARWLQLSGELIANWFDLLGLVSETLIPERDTRSNADPAGASHAVLEVDSARPVRIDARLVPRAHCFELADGELRDRDPDHAAIPFIALADPETAEVTIRARISANQPAGSYRGNVANRATGEILGTLSVEVR